MIKICQKQQEKKAKVVLKAIVGEILGSIYFTKNIIYDVVAANKEE